MTIRPPIVVVLGHVDHGKTTLLDYIRKTNLAAKEAGEITQGIGAWQIEVKKAGKITFIDTPGHEAFMKMRQRGVNVADLAILVVSVTDGVMPQTIEAIKIIQEAKIPMIVVLNKIDLPAINLEKIKKQLVKEKVELEGYGGDVVSLPLSAKTGKGVDELLEMILLLAEMKKITSDEKGPLEAVVIESRLDKQKGHTISVIVKNGTLSKGNEIIAEGMKIKLKAITSDKGENLEKAFPGQPVEILGLSKNVTVGSVITDRLTVEILTESVVPIEPLLKIDPAQQNQLKVILKTDNLGSLEAIMSSLAKMPVPVEIFQTAIGDIYESDVLLAKTVKALIIGFNVKIENSVQLLADQEKVKIRIYQIIYELLDELKEVNEMLNKIEEEKFLGKAQVLAEFPFDKSKICGCKVIEGRVCVGDKIKILRGEEEIGRSKIKSIREQKNIVNKAEIGKDCGLLFVESLDFKVGDIVLSLE